MLINKQDVRVYDNHGKTFDRYTVITPCGWFAMSDNPCSPQGVNQCILEYHKFSNTVVDEKRVLERVDGNRLVNIPNVVAKGLKYRGIRIYNK